MTYYTLRKAGSPEKPTYELSKWEEGETRPTEVYVQWLPQKGDGTYKFHSCNCPSRSTPCKHAEMSLQLLSVADDWLSLAHYYWDGEKVVETGDA